MANTTPPKKQEFQFIEIIEAGELADGERLLVNIDDLSIMIFNVDNHLYAVGNTCTHDDGPLADGELEGFDLICPRHGAKFDIRTGKVLTFPAAKDIPSYPVKIVDNVIQVGLPN